MVPWHGRSCKEMCGAVMWDSKQDDPTTQQSINSMPWWPSFQRRRIEISTRIVKSILSNCSELLALGTYWNPWYSMVSGQTCTIDHKNGPRTVSNDYVIWTLTSITHVNTNSIVMWVILPSNAGWDCFKTQILQDILRIQNLHQVEYCAFLEVIHLFR